MHANGALNLRLKGRTCIVSLSFFDQNSRSSLRSQETTKFEKKKKSKEFMFLS